MLGTLSSCCAIKRPSSRISSVSFRRAFTVSDDGLRSGRDDEFEEDDVELQQAGVSRLFVIARNEAISLPTSDLMAPSSLAISVLLGESDF